MRPSTFPGDRDKGMVRRYAWVMIVTAGLTVAAALHSTRTVPQYSSSAEILVRPTITPSGNYIQPSMPTEQRVATSTDVVEAAAARLGVSPAQTLGHLSVSVPVDTQILVMTYTAATPNEALSGASAAARAFIQDRNPENGKNAVASLVGPAKLPSSPVGANYPVTLGVAVLGGLLSGFGIAWSWDRVRGRIRTPSEAEHLTGLDVLAVVPQPSRVEGQRTSAELAHLDSTAARVLSQLDGERSSVLVTSAGPDCGASAIAAHTALALAQMGRVVILMTPEHDTIRLLSDRPDEPQPTGLQVIPIDDWNRGWTTATQLTNLLSELHDHLPEAVLVIDGPPAWQSAGPALHAGKILLVAALDRSSRTSVAAAAQSLEHCPEKLVGLVLTTPRAHIRVALAAIQDWVGLRVMRVVSRVAPPAPKAPVPAGSVPAVRGPSPDRPQLNGSARKSSAHPAPTASQNAHGTTRPSGGKGQLTGPAPAQVALVERIPARRPNGKAARSKR